MLTATIIEPGRPAYEASALCTTPRVQRTKNVKKLSPPRTVPGPHAYEARDATYDEPKSKIRAACPVRKVGGQTDGRTRPNVGD